MAMMASGNGGSSVPLEESEMDVSMSQTEIMDQGPAANYKTDEAGDAVGDEHSTKHCVIRMLDEMERRVENLRADTLKVEAERDDILTTLDTLSNSQLVHNLEGIDLDEVDRYIKRLAKRSAAVHVEITSERSTFQQESLQSVNSLIDALIKEVKCDAKLARRRCVAYLNSCSDSPEGMAEEHNAIDAEFESAVLGCTIEDQKRVKKRLHGLYSYFATYTVSSDREAT